MATKLPSNLINRFVNAALVDKTANSREAPTLKGTVRVVDGALFAVIDGSDILTPVKTTVAAAEGDRVEVRISDHTATITGNLSDNSVGKNTAESIVEKAFDGFIITNSNFIDGTINGSIFKDGDITGSKINFSTFENGIIEGSVIKDSTITDAQIQNGTITGAKLSQATFDEINGNAIEAVEANIDIIIADSATIKEIEGETAKLKNVTADELTSATGFISDLEADSITAEKVIAGITKTETLEADYAKIDFENVVTANIKQAWIEQLMVQGKIIAQEGTIYYLDAVHINADMIDAGTMKADRLLLSGENGLFYEINATVDGVTAVELSKEEYQTQLHGDKIIAQTITADKINVADLNALNATIGGWYIKSDSLYSGNRDEFNKTDAVGTYLGSDGKVDIGSNTQYIRFDPTTGEMRISANNITLGATDMNGTLNEMNNKIQQNATQITQTGQVVEIGFNQVGDKLNQIDDDWGELRSYIRFVDGNIELGKASNEFKAILTNSELSFEDNGQKVSYINNQRMHITKAEITDYMAINNWKFIQRANGNLSFKWREGQF